MFITLKQLSIQVPLEDLTGRMFVHELDHVGMWPFEVTEHGLMFEAEGVKEVCYASPVGDPYWLTTASEGDACMLTGDEVRYALDHKKV